MAMVSISPTCRLQPRPVTLTVMAIMLLVVSSCTTAMAADQTSHQEPRAVVIRKLAERSRIDNRQYDSLSRPARRRRQDGDEDGEMGEESELALDPESSDSSESDSTSADSDADDDDDDDDNNSDDDDDDDDDDSDEVTDETESSSTALPTPFDTSLGNNFTSQACPDFFNTFLNDDVFQECHPTALLLENSNSFFQNMSDEDRLEASLEASCDASLAQCSPLMSSLASDMVEDSNCGEEYRAGNPIVSQARAGLLAYEPVYRATCLRNEETGDFCFAEALGNETKPEDSFIYYLAIGSELPAGSQPTCEQCLVEVMDIYAGYAVNDEQPLSESYSSAARQVNLACGPDFVNASLPVDSNAASPPVKQMRTMSIPLLFAASVVCLVAF